MLCADFIAQNGTVSPEEMRFLERLGEALMIDRLSRAAFDRAAQARRLTVTAMAEFAAFISAHEAALRVGIMLLGLFFTGARFAAPPTKYRPRPCGGQSLYRRD